MRERGKKKEWREGGRKEQGSRKKEGDKKGGREGGREGGKGKKQQALIVNSYLVHS